MRVYIEAKFVVENMKVMAFVVARDGTSETNLSSSQRLVECSIIVVAQIFYVFHLKEIHYNAWLL